MEIKVRHTSSFVEVKIIEGATTVDLGLLSDQERDAVAAVMIAAVVEMGPSYHIACREWFDKLILEYGMSAA